MPSLKWKMGSLRGLNNMVVMLKVIDKATNKKSVRYQNVPISIAKILESKNMVIKDDFEAEKWIKTYR